MHIKELRKLLEKREEREIKRGLIALRSIYPLGVPLVLRKIVRDMIVFLKSRGWSVNLGLVEVFSDQWIVRMRRV